jgi:A/G-specific adenine glycosylase
MSRHVLDDATEDMSRRLLAWFDHHGRQNLPWQVHRTPYRVWVSEVMLQQTQVSTVVEYFQRFTRRFPDVRALAEAEVDQVLHLWSGLGYYARGRNLHRAAGIVCEAHGGKLPTTLPELLALPGIGRSTAGAILALAHDQRHPILDGNVKRVLCRYHAVDGWPGKTSVEKVLWALAEHHTPTTRVADYTQAIMDLGALVCTRGKPACTDCPLGARCAARRTNRVDAHPAPRPRPTLPVKQSTWAIVTNGAGEVLLEKRPPVGVWGGLWGFPECTAVSDLNAWCRARFGREPLALTELDEREHTFSHFRLVIRPTLMTLPATGHEAIGVMEAPESVWYNTASPATVGLAAPVSGLLAEIEPFLEPTK